VIEHSASGLETALALLVGAVVLVPLSLRFKIGSVLGYLAAGSLIGPWGLGLITDIASIRHLAEFGVVFLLFVIGIEMKPSRLWLMRRQVFGLGGLQVGLSGLALAGILLVAVPSLVGGVEHALLVGLGLALSSTAMGLQVLSERRELNAPHGRLAFAILLFQDLTVPLLLTLVPLVASNGLAMGGDLVLAIAEAAAIIGGAMIGGRFLLRPLLRIVAQTRSAELFTAVALMIVLGMAWLSEVAGLSQALGAFLGGLLLAESEFRHQIEGDIQPFRGLLLGLFFIGVGMTVDYGLLRAEWPLILSAVAVLMVVKMALMVPLCRPFAGRWRDSWRVALLLSQGGEFAFVLFSFAVGEGALGDALADRLVLVVSLSMALTPLLVLIGDAALRRFSPPAAIVVDGSAPQPTVEPGHVIICGFGRVGRTVAILLRAVNRPYLAFDLDLERVAAGRAAGFEVFYGDSSRPEVLRAGHADHAALLVVTLDDPGTTMRLVSCIHQQFPTLTIHARARDLAHSRALQHSGAHKTVPETLEASLVLGESVLIALGTSAETSAATVQAQRADDYAALAPLVVKNTV
jgi:monovalent cation:proton antiporter-2 (CPA2) family protein